MLHIPVDNRLAIKELIVSYVYALICSITILVTIPDMAFAYVDPSVVTYAVQAVAGVAVAVSAVIGVALRRLRMAIFARFGINPHAKKDKDAAFHRMDNEVTGAMYMASYEVEDFLGMRGSVVGLDKQSVTHKGRKRDSRISRFLISICVVAFTVGTLIVIAPLEIVAGSSSDFFFGVRDIAPTLIGAWALITLCLSPLVALAKDMRFRVCIVLIFTLGLCFYLQAMFMNAGLPLADGKAINWSDYDSISLVSLIVWIAVFGILAIAAYKAAPIMVRVCPMIALALLVVQGIGSATLLSGASLTEGQTLNNELIATEEGLLTVAPSNNVVVIVLDTYDTEYLQEAVNQYPDMLDEFTDFAWYTNVVGSYIPTRHAIPFLLTGVSASKNDSWFNWVRHRYEGSYLPLVRQAGYSVGVYSNDMRLEYSSDNSAVSAVLESSMNLTHASSIVELDSPGMLWAMIGCALYRDLPWLLKPIFQFDTPEIKAAMVRELKGYDSAKTAYVYDDSLFFEKLKSMRLTVADQSVGAFRFIHLMGAHEPYRLDANGNPSPESTRVESCVGSMRMVAEYLAQLKFLGVYDDATIIVTADHDRWSVTMDDINEPSTPIILAKPACIDGDRGHPVRQSDAPVVHADVVKTILVSTGVADADYAGKSLFVTDEDNDQQIERYYYTTQESSDDYYDRNIVEWCIKGNSLDFNNWKRTGFVFNADDRFVEYGFNYG